jgi:hypothetical protein
MHAQHMPLCLLRLCVLAAGGVAKEATCLPTAPNTRCGGAHAGVPHVDCESPCAEFALQARL